MSFNVTDILLLLLCKRIRPEPTRVIEEERETQKSDKKEEEDVGVGLKSDVKSANSNLPGIVYT